MSDAGYNVVEIQKRSRHKSLEGLSKYVNVSDERFRQQQRVLENPAAIPAPAKVQQRPLPPPPRQQSQEPMQIPTASSQTLSFSHLSNCTFYFTNAPVSRKRPLPAEQQQEDEEEAEEEE